MLEAVRVLPRGPAGRAGLERGDGIIAVDGEEIRDVVDFLFFTAADRFTLTVKKRSGDARQVPVTKASGESLGLEFAPLRIRRCRNRCIFCFVDQMPPGCRPTLSVKDDDYRASFLYGNYITLSNLTDRDRERIFSQRLSPLYVSVHATDPALRSFMLGNPSAPDIMGELKNLAAGGIRMHTQIVLCPGINDGEHLDRTIRDLAGLYPAVASVAVVPVGLTTHRKKLFPLSPFTRRRARAVLEQTERLGRELRKQYGARLVFASDEFYVKAGKPFPPASFYEDFPQIENGVGMVAEFIRNAARVRLPSAVDRLTVTVITGMSFGPILKERLARLSAVAGLRIRLVTVENRFFGSSVTVAGLLTGSDIVRSLKGRNPGDLVVVPANALKDEDDVFLDGMTRGDLERALKASVATAGSFRDLAGLIRRGRKRER